MVREQPEPESLRVADAARPRRRASLAATLAAISAPIFFGCAPGQSDDTAPPAPPGAVLMLDDEALDEATIDAVAGVWARLDPMASLPHLRQLALTNTLFPLAGARLVDRAARADALVAIERARAAVLAGAPAGELALLSVEERELAGDWQKLTPILWNWALDAEVGDLSPVLEQPGVWCFARLVSRGDAANPRDFACALRVYHRGWLPPDSAQRGIEERFARATLRFVDPSWRDVVPLHWQKKLNAR